MLKDEGIYVLTTEFHYGEDVIPAPHNYYFSSGFLHELLRAAAFVTLDGVDGSLSPHAFNRPVPANLSDLCANPSDAVTDLLLKSAPHVQLLTGGLPFSSMSLVLRKSAPGLPGGVLPMAGLQDSRRFIEAGVRRWKAFVENAQLSLNPFARLSGGRPARGVPRRVTWDGDGTLFHTGYVWLGGAARTVTVDLDAWPVNAGNAAIELRVHRQPTLQPENVTCSSTTAVAIRAGEQVHACLPLSAEEGCSYSVLGKVTTGACWTDHATVRIATRS